MSKAYLVPTFHHDIAYLRSEKTYTAGALLILDEAIRILSTNPDYYYFVEQSWLLEEYWDARPEKRELLRMLARESRFSFAPGFFAVSDMTLPDGESMYMQVTIGKKIIKETIGENPNVCMITDCWGHHGQLPQIMSQCGYDYYVFSRCMRWDVDRQNFIWRGVDGSTIRTHWMSTHYDGIRFPTNAEVENAGELEWVDAGEKGISDLISRNAEKCGSDPQYLPIGGDMCYPSANAPQIIKQLNERKVLPELVFASPAAALDAVDWDNSVEYTGEFISSMQGSFTTNIWIKQKDRDISGQIYALEALSTYLTEKIDFSLAWKLHLKNQFHDILCGTICDEAYCDAESDYRAVDHILTQIKRKLSNREGVLSYFNPLPFECQIRTEKGMLKLPALGSSPADGARIIPILDHKPCLPLVFENEWYHACIDHDGYIISLVEKTNGSQLISENDSKGNRVPFGAVTMQNDMGDNWWALSVPNLNRVTQGYTYNRSDPLFRDDMPTYLPFIKEAYVEYADADSVVIRQKGEVRFWIKYVEFTTSITLSKTAREIIYRTEFTNHSKALRLRVAFPVNELTEKRRQIPYAIMPFGEGEQTTQMFMDARNDKGGLAVINRGTPAGNIEEGVMLLSIFRSAAMEYKCKSELSYNLERDFTIDYAICPHAFAEDEQIWQIALKLNTSFIPFHDSSDGTQFPRIEGAMISCVREIDNDLFVRLYNPFEEERECRITLPKGKSYVMFTDGLANPLSSAIEPSGNTFKFVLAARKVQAILLR